MDFLGTILKSLSDICGNLEDDRDIWMRNKSFLSVNVVLKWNFLPGQKLNLMYQSAGDKTIEIVESVKLPQQAHHLRPIFGLVYMDFILLHRADIKVFDVYGFDSFIWGEYKSFRCIWILSF